MPGLDSTAGELMRKDFASSDADAPVTKLIGKMRQYGQDNVVITEDGRYLGMVSKRDMLRKNVDFGQMKARTVMAKYPALERSTPLADIVQAMYESNARELPVVEKGRVVGAVDITAIIVEMTRIPEFRQLTAAEISSRNPLLLNLGDDLSKAISLMKKNNVKKVPLVDEEGKLQGIIRFEDLMEAYMVQAVEKNDIYRANVWGGHTADRRSALKVKVGGVVSDNYATVAEDASMDKVLELMAGKGVVVLTKHERPSGIITYKNLLHAFEHVNVVPRNIYWIHKPALDSFDQAKVDSTLAECYDKLERKLGEDLKLEVHFKEFHRQGKRKQYLLKLRLAWARKLLEVTKEDWSPLTVTQQAVRALQNAIRRK